MQLTIHRCIIIVYEQYWVVHIGVLSGLTQVGLRQPRDNHEFL